MSEEIQTTDGYLNQLRQSLAGADPAVVQDALNDAQDHIQNERATRPELTEADLVRSVVESFGSAAEVAEAYREIEIKVAQALAPNPPRRDAPPAGPPRQPIYRDPDPWHRLFGMLIDPRAYSALFYMFVALPTGIFYFTWVVTGISLSLGLSILIIGLPFALFFLATVRALSLAEGRVVEALLGERMPRRADQTAPTGSWLDRIGYWLTDARSWSTLLYMVLRLPLGIFSFVLFTTLLSFTLALFAGPILSLMFDWPMFTLGRYEFYPPVWAIPLWWLAGAVTGFVTLHLAVLLGRLYAALAKAMLVKAEHRW
jgi:hypothetical protein